MIRKEDLCHAKLIPARLAVVPDNKAQLQQNVYSFALLITEARERKPEVQMIELKEAQTDQEFSLAVVLFKEYASQLGVDLAFQQFNKDIENIARS